MSDRHPTLPLPDPAAQWVLQSAPPRRPRRAWPWIVALLVVVALAVGAWFAGESIARGIVERTIREQAITQLSLPADQHIDVDLPGPVLPQLIGGRLDTLTLSGRDVRFDQLSGDVVVHATGIPIRGDAPVQTASATVTLDETQVRALLGTVPDFPVDTVTLAAPNIDASIQLQLFGLAVPVGVGLTPSAAAGQLVLTPDTLRVAGAEVPAETLVDQFGALARTVVRDWEVCIAQYLPAGLTLTAVRVDGADVVADFDIAGAMVTDPALREPGTCP